MNRSETILQVSSALIKAKKNFAIAKKSGYNNHLKSHYSNLDDVLEAVEPSLLDNGIMIIQSMLDTSTEKFMHMETLLMHESGEWLSFRYNMPIEKLMAQSYGSTTSYCRRYALCAALSISQSDDDAEIAKKTGRDFEKLIDNCEDLDTLRDVWKQAKMTLGAADWKVTEPKLYAKKADLEVGSARGFKPVKAEKPAKEEKPVDNSQGEKVKSIPQDINGFE